MKNMEEINYKWIAIGILIGYLSPYIMALAQSYLEPEKAAEENWYAH